MEAGDADDIGNDVPDIIDLDINPGPDMMEEVCGVGNPDPAYVEGQPCENEGESYCTDNGAYPRLIAIVGWQCIKPGMVTCVKKEQNVLTWEYSNCDQALDPLRASCGLVKTSAPCLQYDKRAVCCPYFAKSPIAGYGTKCGLLDVGKSSCSPDGQKEISALVWRCGYQAEIASERDEWFDGQEYPKMECESIYAECPYWYGLDYCGRDIKDCRNNEGCTLVEPPDSYSYYSCPGVCFLDDEQDVSRCTTTCGELDVFYASH